MKKTLCNICPQIIRFASCAICSALLIHTADAAVVQRGTTPSAPRPSMGRVTAVSNNAATTSVTTSATAPITESPAISAVATATVAPTAPEISITNKSSQFQNVVGSASTSSVDSSAANLADMIQRQRAALDAQSTATTADVSVQTSLAGRNACDTALRTCMQNKCGKDYSKCKGDTDTIWGDKMDSCRRETTCTGQEYALFTPEIKADRDMNAKIGAFTAIIDCGNQYNDCIVTQCGTTYNKCLGKAAGDAAIAKCATIAKNCTQQDGGLASRTMNVFGTLRQDAEVQIAKDEKRLYELRDEMRSQCARLGAMLDERSLDCVFTVNLYAGSESKLFASKKAYAGSTFNCDQNWFGIDITTFKENAYRETRAQESAVKGFMGAGLGTAVGAVTSGTIGRALDRQKAEKAVKKAEKENKEITEKAKKSGDSSPTSATTQTDGNTSNKASQGGTNGITGQDAQGDQSGSVTPVQTITPADGSNAASTPTGSFRNQDRQQSGVTPAPPQYQGDAETTTPVNGGTSNQQ